jgi:hypothetical protein
MRGAMQEGIAPYLLLADLRRKLLKEVGQRYTNMVTYI